jgi:hypothetical protein
MTASTTAQTIPGFAAFPNLDTAINGDVSLQGSVNSTDTGAMTQQVVGLARPTIPYAPIGLPVTPLGPDTSFAVPAYSSTLGYSAESRIARGKQEAILVHPGAILSSVIGTRTPSSIRDLAVMQGQQAEGQQD